MAKIKGSDLKTIEQIVFETSSQETNQFEVEYTSR